jgi:hypothetical protein
MRFPFRSRNPCAISWLLFPGKLQDVCVTPNAFGVHRNALQCSENLRNLRV